MTGWKENMGMSQDTGLVKIYVPMSHKEMWQQEADEKIIRVLVSTCMN